MIVWMRFLVSLPGVVLVAALVVVAKHPQGSAELVASTLQGLWDFAAILLRLLGVDTETAPAA